jgi:hypothetical protein
MRRPVTWALRLIEDVDTLPDIASISGCID